MAYSARELLKAPCRVIRRVGRMSMMQAARLWLNGLLL